MVVMLHVLTRGTYFAAVFSVDILSPLSCPGTTRSGADQGFLPCPEETKEQFNSSLISNMVTSILASV